MNYKIFLILIIISYTFYSCKNEEYKNNSSCFIHVSQRDVKLDSLLNIQSKYNPNFYRYSFQSSKSAPLLLFSEIGKKIYSDTLLKCKYFVHMIKGSDSISYYEKKYGDTNCIYIQYRDSFFSGYYNSKDKYGLLFDTPIYTLGSFENGFVVKNILVFNNDFTVVYKMDMNHTTIENIKKYCFEIDHLSRNKIIVNYNQKEDRHIHLLNIIKAMDFNNRNSDLVSIDNPCKNSLERFLYIVDNVK